MSRRNSNKILLPWATATADSKSKRFTQVCHSLRVNEKFQKLKYSTRYIYECMLDESKGKREFEFPRHVAKQYGLNGTILNSAIKELEAAGFITIESGQNTRTANKYRFSLEWKTSPQELKVKSAKRKETDESTSTDLSQDKDD